MGVCLFTGINGIPEGAYSYIVFHSYLVVMCIKILASNNSDSSFLMVLLAMDFYITICSSTIKGFTDSAIFYTTDFIRLHLILYSMDAEWCTEAESFLPNWLVVLTTLNPIHGFRLLKSTGPFHMEFRQV